MNARSFLSAVAVVSAVVAAPVMAQADNTNSKSDPTFNTWMHGYAGAHNGRISRQAYMDEAGQRWDAMDREHRGLTTQEIDSMYGYQPTPGRVQPGTNGTNPTGTEARGQNSGGK